MPILIMISATGSRWWVREADSLEENKLMIVTKHIELSALVSSDLTSKLETEIAELEMT
jgi:hypothetical protein